MPFSLADDTVKVAVVAKGADPTALDWQTAGWVVNAPTQKAPSLSHLSTEYRYFKVTATVVNDDDGSTESDAQYCRVLIGPGTGGFFAQDAAATMDAYVQIGDDPEIVVQKAGTIQFT